MLCLGVVFLGGCATIVAGTTQKISINSNVDGAEVLLQTISGDSGNVETTAVVSEKSLGKTPLNIEVNKEDLENAVLTVRKEGYTSQKLTFQSEITGAFWINILSGGLFGSSTDFSTGAVYKYSPTEYFAQLAPVAGGGGTPENPWKKPDGALLRHFSLMAFDGIVMELTSQPGEHLAALLELMNVEPAQWAAVLEELHAEVQAGADPLQFSHTVLALAHM